MARLTDAIIQPTPQTGEKYQPRAYGQGYPALDLKYGGQMGYAPNMREWVSSKPLVLRDTVNVLLEPPRGFALMSEDAVEERKWIEALSAFVSLHPISTEGFNSQIDVESGEQPFGGANEMFQTPVNSTRVRTEPVINTYEKSGGPIQHMLEQYIRQLIMDPETKYPLATTHPDAPQDWLPDWYTFTMLTFRPDAMFRYVTRAWITTNMYPTTTGPIEGRRSLAESNANLELTIPFTGITESNQGTVRFAQRYLDAITTRGANPYTRNSFLEGTFQGGGVQSAKVGGASSGIGSAGQGTGFADGIDDIIRDR